MKDSSQPSKTNTDRSNDVSLQKLRLEEDTLVKKISEINAEQESGVGIVFKTNKKRTVYLRYELMTKLDTIKREVSEQFSVERWNRLISSQLEEREVQDTIECAKRFVFNRQTENNTLFDALQELSFFESTACISDTTRLASTLQLAMELEYTRIDELCKEALYRVDDIQSLLSTFLEITPRTRDRGGSKKARRVVDDLLDTINTDKSKIREEYKKTKEECNVRWRVDKSVLGRLFTRNRALEQEDVHGEAFNFTLENYKTLLQLRVIDYPEEESVYQGFLGVYTQNRYTRKCKKEKNPDVTIVEVNLRRMKVNMKNIQRCIWHRLVIERDADVNFAFCGGRDREVDELVLKNSNMVRREDLTKNKIVVNKSLEIDNVEGDVDFVDTESIERVLIYEVGAVNFCYDKQKQIFTNTKTLFIKYCSLRILVHKDGTLLFPNLESLTIKKCKITKRIYKIITASIRIMYIDRCDFDSSVTVDDLRAQIKCKSVLINEGYTETFLRIRSSEGTEDSDSGGYTRKMNSMPLYFPDIAKRIEENPEYKERARERIRTSMVSINEKYKLYADTMRSMEEEIVFLEVDNIDNYIELKREYGLRSLRHLEVFCLKSEKSLKTEKKNLEKSLEIEKQRLDVLIVLCDNDTSKEDELDVLVRALFDSRLACLKIEFNKNIKFQEAFLDYFRNLRILLVSIEGGLHYEGYGGVINRIQRLEKLEVLDIKLYNWYENNGERVELFELARSILERSKTIKRVVISVCDYNTGIYNKISPVVVTEDNRRYKTRMKNGYNTRNVYNGVMKEMVLIDKEVQEAFYQKYLIDKELESDNPNSKCLKVTYDLME